MFAHILHCRLSVETLAEGVGGRGNNRQYNNNRPSTETAMIMISCLFDSGIITLFLSSKIIIYYFDINWREDRHIYIFQQRYSKCNVGHYSYYYHRRIDLAWCSGETLCARVKRNKVISYVSAAGLDSIATRPSMLYRRKKMQYNIRVCTKDRWKSGTQARRSLQATV